VILNNYKTRNNFFKNSIRFSLNISIFVANKKISIMNQNSMQEANAPRHYILLIIAIVIGIVGVYLRFADFKYSSAVSNIILIIGVIISLKAVFTIMK
jgi:hypothetical protein